MWAAGSAVADVCDAGCGSGVLGEDFALQVGDGLPRVQPPVDLPADTRIRTVSTSGTIGLDSVTYMVDAQRSFQQVLVVSDVDKISRYRLGMGPS